MAKHTIKKFLIRNVFIAEALEIRPAIQRLAFLRIAYIIFLIRFLIITISDQEWWLNYYLSDITLAYGAEKDLARTLYCIILITNNILLTDYIRQPQKSFWARIFLEPNGQLLDKKKINQFERYSQIAATAEYWYSYSYSIGGFIYEIICCFFADFSLWYIFSYGLFWSLMAIPFTYGVVCIFSFFPIMLTLIGLKISWEITFIENYVKKMKVYDRHNFREFFNRTHAIVQHCLEQNRFWSKYLGVTIISAGSSSLFVIYSTLFGNINSGTKFFLYLYTMITLVFGVTIPFSTGAFLNSRIDHLNKSIHYLLRYAHKSAIIPRIKCLGLMDLAGDRNTFTLFSIFAFSYYALFLYFLELANYTMLLLIQRN